MMKKLIAIAVIAVTLLTLITSDVPVQAQEYAVSAEGGGWFYGAGSFRDNFGFWVSGGAWDGWHYLNPDGSLNYQGRSDEGVTFKVRCYDISGWGCNEDSNDGWYVYLDGPALVNRGYGWEDGYHFYVLALDNGEPGKSDWFSIEVLGPNYYYSEGTLGGGNIKLYR